MSWARSPSPALKINNLGIPNFTRYSVTFPYPPKTRPWLLINDRCFELRDRPRFLGPDRSRCKPEFQSRGLRWLAATFSPDERLVTYDERAGKFSATETGSRIPQTAPAAAKSTCARLPEKGRDPYYFPSTENTSSTLPGMPPHWL